MAERRSLCSEEIKKIENKKAVAEAFGYYFNSEGEVVHKINTIGIDLDKFKQTKNLIAIAGGVGKIEAILALTKLDSRLVLVTDENVANQILRRFKEEKDV
jgi:central glycolytic genes regulator